MSGVGLEKAAEGANPKQRGPRFFLKPAEGARDFISVAGICLLLLLALACERDRPSPNARPKDRLTDHAGLISSGQRPRFETYLDQMFTESGVDVRFLFVRQVLGETLEEFANRMAGETGVGRATGARGTIAPCPCGCRT